MVSSLQTESEGVDLMTLLRETPREAYSYQQLGVRRATDVEPPPNQDRFNNFIARSFPPSPSSSPPRLRTSRSRSRSRTTPHAPATPP